MKKIYSLVLAIGLLGTLNILADETDDFIEAINKNDTKKIKEIAKITKAKYEKKYPIHYAVITLNYDKLNQMLQKKKMRDKLFKTDMLDNTPYGYIISENRKKSLDKLSQLNKAKTLAEKEFNKLEDYKKQGIKIKGKIVDTLMVNEAKAYVKELQQKIEPLTPIEEIKELILEKERGF